MASQPTPLLAYLPERKKDFIVGLIKGTPMVFISPVHKPGHLRKIEDREKPYSCVGHIGDYTTQLYHSIYLYNL